jgi:hypothetical protein
MESKELADGDFFAQSFDRFGQTNIEFFPAIRADNLLNSGRPIRGLADWKCVSPWALNEGDLSCRHEFPAL